MAIPTFVAVSPSRANLGSDTYPWPTHQADDIGLLVLETGSEVITVPDGWALVADSENTNADAVRLTILWRRATSDAEAGVLIVDPGDHQLGKILTFRGCITTGDPWDIIASDTSGATASTTVTVPGGTTTVADCLIIAAGATGTDSGTSGIGSWANADLASVTQRTTAASATGSGGCFGVGSGGKATAGAFGATTFAVGTSNVQARIMIALKPPGAGAVTVTPSAAIAAAVSANPSVVRGAIVVTPTGAASAATSVANPSISGAATITPIAAEARARIGAPVVRLGALTLAPVPAAAKTATTSPTILTPLLVTPVAAAARAAVVTPASVLGSVLVTPTPASAETGVANPSVGGAVTVTPESADARAAVGAPVPVLGALTLNPDPAEALSLANDPNPILGPLVLAPAPASAATGIANPSLGGGVTVSPAHVAARAGVEAPAVVLGALLVTAAAAVARTAVSVFVSVPSLSNAIVLIKFRAFAFR